MFCFLLQMQLNVASVRPIRRYHVEEIKQIFLYGGVLTNCRPALSISYSFPCALFDAYSLLIHGQQQQEPPPSTLVCVYRIHTNTRSPETFLQLQSNFRRLWRQEAFGDGEIVGDKNKQTNKLYCKGDRQTHFAMNAYLLRNDEAGHESTVSQCDWMYCTPDNSLWLYYTYTVQCALTGLIFNWGCRLLIFTIHLLFQILNLLITLLL